MEWDWMGKKRIEADWTGLEQRGHFTLGIKDKR